MPREILAGIKKSSEYMMVSFTDFHHLVGASDPDRSRIGNFPIGWGPTTLNIRFVGLEVINSHYICFTCVEKAFGKV